MLWTLISLMIILLVIWYWLTTIRNRELALDYARQMCKDYGWQLLDESIAVNYWRLVWTGKGIKIKRSYQFDYAKQGTDRGIARIMLLGNAVIRHETTKDKSDREDQANADTIVQFRRPHNGPANDSTRH